MNPAFIAVASLTILTGFFIYISEKRENKKLSLREWLDEDGRDGFMKLIAIAVIYYLIVDVIDARTHWSISGYPPIPDEESGMQYPF